MNFFRLNPFARILLPFILGIVLSNITLISNWLLFSWISICFIALVIGYFFIEKSDKKWSRVFYGISVFLLFLCAGAFHFKESNKASIQKINLVKAQIDNPSLRIFRVKTTPINNNFSYKSEVEWVGFSGEKINGIAYFKDSTNLPNKGNVISIHSRIQAFEKPSNPGQFDFANYAHSNDWYFSVFVESWESTNLKIEPNLLDRFSELRAYFLSILRLYIDGDEFAISSALVFGDKASLSPEIKQAYSGAGAMHVLAVSGLHVGLVYLFLKYLLSFLNKSRKSKIFKTLLIIILIFSYAGITGFSPSVTRASFMFSLIAIGGILRRSSSIYNIIFVSAFGMLLFDPRLLFNVSFQLSYIAVIGIIFLYPRLILLWDPKTWLGYNIWSLVCLSLSAQISTFALALYYFKLFPTWFLLTNLVVVPGAMLELGGGFVLIASHFVGMGEWVGWIYGSIIYFINEAVLFIDSIPPGPLGISYNSVQLALSYLLLALLFLLVDFPKKRILYSSVASFVLLLISYSVIDYSTERKHGILVYDSKNLMVEIFHGSESIIYTDTTYSKFKKDLDYIIKPSHQKRNMKKYKVEALVIDSISGCLLSLDSFTLQIILGGNEKFKLVNDNNRTFILAAILKSGEYMKVKKELDSLNVDYWDIRKKGCFEMVIE